MPNNSQLLICVVIAVSPLFAFGQDNEIGLSFSAKNAEDVDYTHYSSAVSKALFVELLDSMLNVQLRECNDTLKKSLIEYNQIVKTDEEGFYEGLIMQNAWYHFRFPSSDREGKRKLKTDTLLFLSYHPVNGEKTLYYYNTERKSSFMPLLCGEFAASNDISSYVLEVLSKWNVETIYNESKKYAKKTSVTIVCSRVIFSLNTHHYKIDCIVFPQYTHPDYPESAVNPPPRYRDPKEGFIIMMDEDGLCKEYDESFKKVFQ